VAKISELVAIVAAVTEARDRARSRHEHVSASTPVAAARSMLRVSNRTAPRGPQGLRSEQAFWPGRTMTKLILGSGETTVNVVLETTMPASVALTRRFAADAERAESPKDVVRDAGSSFLRNARVRRARDLSAPDGPLCRRL
jgi:hypothetical protein